MVPTQPDDPSESGTAEELAATHEVAAADTDDASVDAVSHDDEDPFPPALIVAARAPDRAASRIIGVMTPEEARLGATVTFAISPRGRLAERVATSTRSESPSPSNVHSRPHPRISALPTRVATSTSLEVGDRDRDGSDDA